MSEQYEVLAVRYGTRQASAAEVFLNYHAYHEPDRPLIVPATFDSGFSLRLMLKDMRIGLGLAEAAGTPARLSAAATALWAEAAGALPADADHTEIARWLDPGLELSGCANRDDPRS